MAQINIQIEGMSIKEAQAVMTALTKSVADVDLQTTAAPEKKDDLPPELRDDLPGDLGQGGKGPSKSEKAKRKSSKKDANVVDLDEKRTGTAMEKLAKFTKLVDVIEVLRENGFADDDALIAECERVKDQVPVLKKIPDLTGRVKRVLERLSA